MLGGDVEGLCLSRCNGQESLPGSKELYYSCIEVARKVSSCRMVVANRGSHSMLGGDFDVAPSLVLFSDCWVNGDAVCVQERRVSDQPLGSKWADGFTWPKSMYSAESILRDVVYPSALSMWRRQGEPSFVVYDPLPAGEEVYSGFYDAQPATQLACPSLAPFLAFKRAWDGHQTLLDRILNSTSADDWVVVEAETVSGKSLIKVRVKAGFREVPTKQGVLGIGQIYYLWCDRSHHLSPVRATSVVEYMVDGEWYPNNAMDGSQACMAEYLAYEFLDFEGVDYPKHGADKQFLPDVENISDLETFDADAIMAQIREKGAYVSPEKTKEFVWEWKVLHLSQIDLSTNLWVPPPDGVLLKAGEDVRIAGKSVEDSRILLGKMPPNVEAVIIRRSRESYRKNLMIAVAVNALLVGIAAIVWFRRRQANA